MIVQFDWNPEDASWCAAYHRDGTPWILNGALVGIGNSQADALIDLTGIARHLVLHGENFLTEGQIPIEARRWLFSMLDFGEDYDDTLYLALRRAENPL